MIVENLTSQLPFSAQWGTLVRTPMVWERKGPASFGRTGEVHVFLVRADVGAETLAGRAALLSAAEQARAGRFRFERDRNRYIAAHGALRNILNAYTGVKPRDIEIRYDTFGKPLLVGPRADSRIEFNLSHAGERALIAVSGGIPVGIDIERVPAGREWAGLAEVCLSSEEKRSLTRIPADRVGETVYRWWTRKEALAKAAGTGLALPLPHYQVVPPFLLDAGTGTRESGRCVWDITPCPGYVAALVVEAPPHAVSLKMFDDARV